MTLLIIALGAGLGAPARYLTDRAVQSRHDTALPWGTLTVNLIACLVLGVLTGAATHVGTNWSLFLGTGLCATLSTYSTFSYETLRLLQGRLRLAAAGNVAVSVLAGVGAAALGWWLGSLAG
jgi:fluoride exporter